MTKICSLFLMSLFSISCATMNDSLQLGGGMGAIAGAASTFAAHKATNGHSPEFGSVALGAGIGALVGLTTAYFTHKKVEETRELSGVGQPEMFFGDLPPSPFVVPQMPIKNGGR